MNLESKHIRAKQSAWRLGCATWLIAGAFALKFEVNTILVAVLAVAVLFCVWIIVEGFYWQGKRAETLQRDLGFCHGSPYVQSNGKFIEVLTIQSVTPGGRFDQAGFKPGDIIVDDVSITEMYRTLHKARGNEPLTITVVSGTDDQPMRDRVRRRISLSVPASPAA